MTGWQGSWFYVGCGANHSWGMTKRLHEESNLRRVMADKASKAMDDTGLWHKVLNERQRSKFHDK